MLRNVPPFRADHVGSLLRPAALKEPERVRRAARYSVEHCGPWKTRPLRTSSETSRHRAPERHRRRIPARHVAFRFSGAAQRSGIVPHRSRHTFPRRLETEAKGLRVTGKWAFQPIPCWSTFGSCSNTRRATPKMTIPSPSVLHFRGGRKAVSREVYPDMEEFYHDLGLAYRAAVQAFADAGCRYLQLDETNLAYLCDTEQVRSLAERGDDPARLPGIYARMLNTAIEAGRTTWRSPYIFAAGISGQAGSRREVTNRSRELLFNGIGVNGYFMDLTASASGGFEPLRFVPKDKMWCLGW